MRKIAVGCGKREYPGYIHVDGDLSFSHVEHSDVWLNDEKNNSVDVIYSCHLLNYFEREEAEDLLARWYFKLKPGGTLRLAVPDFYEMARLYRSSQVTLSEISGPLMGNWQMGDKRISHKSVWDWDQLAMVLEDIGFSRFDGYIWQDTEHSFIDDHASAYLAPKGDKENGTLISLNIEAVK